MWINETFTSLQGEGPDAGKRAFFIRTTGCNVRCSFCDTAYAFTVGDEFSVAKMIDTIKRCGTKLVVVTGGEPLLQQEELGNVVNQLCKGFNFAIETNGTLPRPKWWKKVIWDVDCKCPSSGVDKFNRDWLMTGEKNRLKFVVSSEIDLLFVSECIARMRQWELCPTILVSPMTPNSLAYDMVQNRRWLQRVWE